MSKSYSVTASAFARLWIVRSALGMVMRDQNMTQVVKESKQPPRDHPSIPLVCNKEPNHTVRSYQILYMKMKRMHAQTCLSMNLQISCIHHVYEMNYGATTAHKNRKKIPPKCIWVAELLTKPVTIIRNRCVNRIRLSSYQYNTKQQSNSQSSSKSAMDDGDRHKRRRSLSNRVLVKAS
ncbi:hypothetical protein V6N13_060883 [Hibiscus sabdariffa]|uniref:Uncharacterized protein n=2 Tax=Hibiscus sabdariffa TaxID=183260 RepID=A0ABR2P773_9ROSI